MNKRVIITGHRGYIGRLLTQRLILAGVDVIGIDLPEVDVLDSNALSAAFQSAPGSTVIHLAALSDAGQCEQDPAQAFRKNSLSVAYVLQACVAHKISRLIFPSTAYVYGTRYKGDLKEDAEPCPEGIYALSKLTAETMIKGYAAIYNLSCDILRISNIYGPDVKPNTVLGEIISQSQRQGTISLRDVSPVRDFIYIDDIIETFSRLIIAPPAGFSVLNISTGRGTSIAELAALFCQVHGLSTQIVMNTSANTSRLVLNNAALHQRLGWKPTIDLKEGLRNCRLCQNVK